jgi:peptidoglycan/xylan/chitin deacetylase (PgdA/CDA1 family)
VNFLNNITNQTSQLFKIKLVYFFLITLIISVSFSAGAAENIDYLKEYSGRRLVPIYKVQRNDNKIALTVDGAWGSSKTEELLKLFEVEEIPVSFFFAGIWLENNHDLVKKITKAGHQIYNHSYSHQHFNNLNKEKIREELFKTEAIIDKYQSSDLNIKLFRPPYGEYNELVIKTAREMGYKIIQWSLDSHDWMDPGKSYIEDRINKNINSGEILLFHNNSNNIVEILTEIIPMLKKEYKFVKIEDLIYNNNYQINSLTGLQSKIKDDDNGN